MRHIEKQAREELIEFLVDFGLSSVMEEPQLQSRLGKCFKKYYPLLLIEAATAGTAIWGEKDKSESFQLYIKESISDICQSFVLASAGFYKPAQLTLRSGLENSIRCIGISEGQKVLELKSTFELFDVVKLTPIVHDNKLAKKYFSALRNDYSALCGSVHTSNASHMALTTFAGAYPRYQDADAARCFDLIENVCANALYLIVIVLRDTVARLHHRHFDIVCDALPKKLKQELWG